jgi:dTDP-4-dehydrorhamnose reductase
MTIAVLGSNGMLGSDLCPLLEKAGHSVTRLDLPAADISNSLSMDRELNPPVEAIVNCAAFTNVDGAETDKETAYSVNHIGVLNACMSCQKYRPYFLQISTDFVFDGTKKTPYTEDDAPIPLSVYGKSKYCGEDVLRYFDLPWGVLRLQWTYGHHGRSFISKIAEKLKTDNTLCVVDDQIGSPTNTRDAADAILHMVETEAAGIYHYAARGYASRYDVAAFVAEKLNSKARLVPCRSADFPTAAQRPLNSRFCCRKIEKVLDLSRPLWTDSLASHIKEFYS